MNTAPTVPQPTRPSRGSKIAIVFGAAVIGAVLLGQLEGTPMVPLTTYIARTLGTAVVPFIVAIFPAAFIRGWLGVFVGILVICLMNYFVSQGIIAGQK